ncbi:putative 26S proteasome subunit RPN7 [Lyophyllum shimeji]|uniref:26S proteasome subunit RPN7 n=1 Tax=Lyophyllum shimeji TaxID=47721 RepID=A0A9P3UH76_LYOSH|nr:putative 26S proteasome subunit RPN7 [Lyophyllum shimeji]
MDIDDENQQSTSSQPQPSRRIIAPVDEAHPFDLESYISNYSGRTAIDRLILIIQTCPSIAPEALQLAVQHIHQSRDPSLYQHVVSVYEQLAASPDLPVQLPSPMEIAPLDTKWADETLSRNQAEKTKLEVELKTYSNNMIKESIRMAHRDLGYYYRSVGEYSSSLKHFTKSREYCATSQHVLDMCLSVLEILLEQRNYTHLSTYVFKADAALDATLNTSNGSSGAAGGSASAQAAAAKKKTSIERQQVQSKLDLATALSHLGQANYEKAAYSFLKVGPAKELGDWIGKVIAPGDIAVYGTLCALSSLPRSALGTQLLGNPVFSVYLEQEPYIRELIEAYMSSNFKIVLDILARYSTRHLIDIHLAPHITELTDQIRNWAVVLYFQPFATIKLHRMSKAFGWTVEEVERHVVQLIQAGSIHGRVDSQDKILYAKKTDYRADLFARAIKTGTDIQAANRKLLLRMKLQQADLVIKPPKGSHPSAAMAEMIGRE